MKTCAEETLYRTVLDDHSDEVVGIVKIEARESADHWIIDANGNRRNIYRYVTVEPHVWENNNAFKLFPILRVIYHDRLLKFSNMEDTFSVIAFISGLGFTVVGLVLGGYIVLSDALPAVGHTWWFQLIFWGLIGSFIGCGIGGISASEVGDFLRRQTKRDRILESWKTFLEENVHTEDTRKNAENHWREIQKIRREEQRSKSK